MNQKQQVIISAIIFLIVFFGTVFMVEGGRQLVKAGADVTSPATDEVNSSSPTLGEIETGTAPDEVNNSSTISGEIETNTAPDEVNNSSTTSGEIETNTATDEVHSSSPTLGEIETGTAAGEVNSSSTTSAEIETNTATGEVNSSSPTLGEIETGTAPDEVSSSSPTLGEIETNTATDEGNSSTPPTTEGYSTSTKVWQDCSNVFLMHIDSQIYKCIGCNKNKVVHESYCHCYKRLPQELITTMKECCMMHFDKSYCMKAARGRFNYRTMCVMSDVAAKVDRCLMEEITKDESKIQQGLEYKQCLLNILNKYCDLPYKAIATYLACSVGMSRPTASDIYPTEPTVNDSVWDLETLLRLLPGGRRKDCKRRRPFGKKHNTLEPGSRCIPRDRSRRRRPTPKVHQRKPGRICRPNSRKKICRRRRPGEKIRRRLIPHKRCRQGDKRRNICKRWK